MIFVVQGDITQIAADAIVFSTGRNLMGTGKLHSAFLRNVPSFYDRFEALRSRSDSPCDPGGVCWLPLAREDPPYGVVVLIATGAQAKIREGIANAVKLALAEASAKAQNGRVLVAFPALRFGGGGDRHDRLNSARLQIEGALDAVLAHPQLDVAFVCYKADDYQVYLEARRLVRSARHAEWPRVAVPALPAALVDAFHKEEGVLFIGSGMSAGAGLPGWAALIRHLEATLEIDPQDRHDLDYFLDLAQWYRESPYENAEPLVQVIQRIYATECEGVHPTLGHYLLCSLPVRHLITTNYDDLLERALRALRRYAVAVVRPEEVARTGSRDATFVVKLHGDARRGEGIVLARDDYDTFFQKQPAMAALVEGLLLNQTFLFVGYSLRDPDFRQIHHRIGAMLQDSRRTAYAVNFERLGEPAVRQWRNKRMELISMPGPSRAEMSRALLVWLDQLAEAVSGTRRLLMAHDARSPAAAGDPLRLLSSRLELVGEEIERLGGGDRQFGSLSGVQQQEVEWVLRFLTDHGWRPQHGTLSRLWRSLAVASRGETRRRRLIVALELTETLKEAEAIFAELEVT